ncbi:hypothetical protein ABIA13_002355 [Sinorhizobium fredii]
MIGVVLPSFVSTCAVTSLAPFSTLVTLASVKIFMPRFSSSLRARAEISASSTGITCGRSSTTVTSTPIER